MEVDNVQAKVLSTNAIRDFAGFGFCIVVNTGFFPLRYKHLFT